jgi:hypothetical protein
MPKWSEVPWGTVIAGTIAFYGAALSTFNFLLQRRRDRIAASDVQRAQAEQVSGWLVPYEGPAEPGRLFLGLVLKNGSGQLVYQLIASLISTQGAFRKTAVGDNTTDEFEFRVFVGLLPPGETKRRIEFSGHGMMLRFGIELAFQDAAGHYWLRRGDGALRQVDKAPLALYEIDPPVAWEHP